MKLLKKAVVPVGAVILASILLLSSTSAVKEGYIGVKYQFGKIIETNIQPGLHFKAPFAQTIKSIDIKTQVLESQTAAYTKDSQTVENISFAVNYAYGGAEKIIKTIGISAVETSIVEPRVNAILKNNTGKYKAEELISNRALLQSEAQEELANDLSESGIRIVKFSIKDLSFEDSFEQSIRNKVEAEQNALRIKNETVAKEEEAKRQIIAAQAESDSRKLEAEAEAYAIEVKAQAEAKAVELMQEQLAKNPAYVDFVRAQNWNGEYPKIITGDSLTMLDVSSALVE